LSGGRFHNHKKIISAFAGKDVGMPKATIVVLLMVFSLINSGCGPSIGPEETKVLDVLDEIQRGMASNISLEQFEQLLETARAELTILEQSSEQNPCFMGAVKKSYASYRINREPKKLSKRWSV